MTSTKIYAFFESRARAEAARDRLQQLGLARERVNVIEQKEAQQLRTAEHEQGKGGFWAHVKAMFTPESHRATIDEGLRRGGYLVIASVADEQHTQAVTILEQSGAVDLEEHEAQWRASGWNAQPAQSTPREGSRRDEDTIPVVEERLRVGKRPVNRGAVRVRSFIVEEPVHEEVRLREEHVDVERRPVNEPTRPVARGAPDDLLQERSVELNETAEQAVVAKEAVITEEVQVRKRADERVESIDDKVRRTEVEVDDRRTDGRKPTDGSEARPPHR